MNTSRRLSIVLQNSSARRGFTLVELLVVVVVLLVLAALTLTALTVASEEDVAEGARSGQSFTEGARDRAIYRKRPVGVRLLLDPNGTTNNAGNPVVVTSLQYVGSPSETLKGVLVVDATTGTPTPADEGQILTNANAPAAQFTQVWDNIRTNRGLISRNIAMPIKIAVDAATPPTMEEFIVTWSDPPPPGGGRWVISRPHPFPGAQVAYELELLPAVMPYQQIREMPRDAVINLPDSKIPSFWYSPPLQQYTSYMDILFSPRGTGIGSASGSGMIHLHVCSPEDRERVAVPSGPYFIGKNVPHVIGNPRNVEPERLISINPDTGNITVSDVPKFTDANQDDIPDLNADGDPATNYDPFRPAEFGVTAQ